MPIVRPYPKITITEAKALIFHKHSMTRLKFEWHRIRIKYKTAPKTNRNSDKLLGISTIVDFMTVDVCIKYLEHHCRQIELVVYLQ